MLNPVVAGQKRLPISRGIQAGSAAQRVAEASTSIPNLWPHAKTVLKVARGVSHLAGQVICGLRQVAAALPKGVLDTLLPSAGLKKARCGTEAGNIETLRWAARFPHNQIRC